MLTIFNTVEINMGWSGVSLVLGKLCHLRVKNSADHKAYIKTADGSLVYLGLTNFYKYLTLDFEGLKDHKLYDNVLHLIFKPYDYTNNDEVGPGTERYLVSNYKSFQICPTYYNYETSTLFIQNQAYNYLYILDENFNAVKLSNVKVAALNMTLFQRDSLLVFSSEHDYSFASDKVVYSLFFDLKKKSYTYNYYNKEFTLDPIVQSLTTEGKFPSEFANVSAIPMEYLKDTDSLCEVLVEFDPFHFESTLHYTDTSNAALEIEQEVIVEALKQSSEKLVESDYEKLSPLLSVLERGVFGEFIRIRKRIPVHTTLPPVTQIYNLLHELEITESVYTHYHALIMDLDPLQLSQFLGSLILYFYLCANLLGYSDNAQVTRYLKFLNKDVFWFLDGYMSNRFFFSSKNVLYFNFFLKGVAHEN